MLKSLRADHEQLQRHHTEINKKLEQRDDLIQKLNAETQRLKARNTDKSRSRVKRMGAQVTGVCSLSLSLLRAWQSNEKTTSGRTKEQSCVCSPDFYEVDVNLICILWYNTFFTPNYR